jgi:hypothetical protein
METGTASSTERQNPQAKKHFHEPLCLDASGKNTAPALAKASIEFTAGLFSL